MKVALVMGSLSDLSKVESAITLLKKFDVEVEVRCFSAHRTPKQLEEYVSNSKDIEVFIAAAGMAAALPGVIASLTVTPVIGLPISCSNLDGLDALLSIVQMPSGVPVATVAINGSKNAAYLALQIIGNKHQTIKEKLIEERKQNKEAVLKANKEVSAKY